VWRRIHIIEFPVTIPLEARDPNLFESLVEELPGILNWGLDGLGQWERDGLSPPEAVRRSTQTYRLENDTVGQFIEAACVRDPDARVIVKELYSGYILWCENSGYDALSTSQFGKEMTRLGFEVVKGNKGNGRKGIRLA
jgi:putative DNA primase/helicase